jgi:PadR family transcriptional regulator PadR
MGKYRTSSAQTTTLLAVMLSQRSKWMYGYELSDSAQLKSGTLYPILMRLSDRGFLESKWQPSPHAGRPQRRMYKLTAQGIALAREHCDHVGAKNPNLAPGSAR